MRGSGTAGSLCQIGANGICMETAKMCWEAQFKREMLYL